MSFDDVPPDHQFYGDIEWARDNNISAGTGNNKFRPDEPVTRGQMAAFLRRLYKKVKPDEPDPEPEPPPPDPEPEPPPPAPPPDRDFLVTKALSMRGQTLNSYIGWKIPTNDGIDDGNTLHGQTAHRLHTDGTPHHHGSWYGHKMGEGNNRLSHIDFNFSDRLGSSKPPPYIRIEETDVHVPTLVLTATDGGRWELFNNNGALATRRI